MGKHKKNSVPKHATHSEPKRRGATPPPSAALRRIYDERQKLPTGETLERLHSVIAGLVASRSEGEGFHPDDIEVIWLILGELVLQIFFFYC